MLLVADATAGAAEDVAVIAAVVAVVVGNAAVVAVVDGNAAVAAVVATAVGEAGK